MPRPFLLIVAGPNGAGKTTLTRLLRQRGIEFGEYINPDDIGQDLSGSYDTRVAQAQIAADRRREECLEARRSFSFETVMSHPSKVDILLRARAAGFFVQLFFVGTDDSRTNIDRVALRVAQGGHDVPEDRIVARWHRTMQLLHPAIASVEQAFLFDNSISGYGHLDAVPRLVFRRHLLAAGPVSEQFPPVPAWVRHYALAPLGIAPSNIRER